MAGKAKTNTWLEEKLKSINSSYIRIGEYIGANYKIDFKCTNCGSIVNRKPSYIVSNKNRCRVCFSKSRLKSEETFDLELSKVSSIVRLETYKGRVHPILFKCKNGHTWKTQPGHVLNGSDCPLCSDTSFKNNSPCILYFVKIKHTKELFKVGVTGNSVSKRFKGDTDLIESVILEMAFSKGSDAKIFESRVLETFKEFKVTDPCDKILKYGGNTELLYKDVSVDIRKMYGEVS